MNAPAPKMPYLPSPFWDGYTTGFATHRGHTRSCIESLTDGAEVTKRKDDGPAVVETPAAEPPVDTFGEILGAAFWLAARSEDHRQMSFGAVADAVLVSVELRQFQLWRNDGAPFAFACWAMLDAAAEAKLRAGTPLTKEEHQSGEQAWLIMVISPYLPSDALLKELRDKRFSGRSLMAMV